MLLTLTLLMEALQATPAGPASISIKCFKTIDLFEPVECRVVV